MMFFHPSFTSPVKNDPHFFQPFNLLSSISQGVSIFSLPCDPSPGGTIGACERVKEGRDNNVYVNDFSSLRVQLSSHNCVKEG